MAIGIIASFIINLVIGVALSVGSTLIRSALDQDKKQAVAGVRGSIQGGGDNPLSFIVGYYATAGQLEYAGTWGNAGETPNAYFTKVISLTDLPAEPVAMFVNGERVTIGGVASGDLGFPVTEYIVDGVEHLWVKLYDGTQAVADPLLVAKFGGSAERPWDSSHVGTGIAYAVVTALVNRDKFAGFPDYLFELQGLKLYDPRKDTTVGGSGAHRLNNPATWEYTPNPVVQIYNILLGIKYAGTWVWGPQGIGQGRLPFANWTAQMDKCDQMVSLAAGGQERRYRAALEISTDSEPHAIIGELLKACAGRIAEIGGIYKILVGEPGDPVKSFTDEDIVITEGQTFEPFPGLESTYNGITATHPSPDEAWASKDAPPRYDAGLEAADDNRRLPFSTDFKAVPFAKQVQRLMRAAIVEARRFRRHTFTAPPEWWELEPLDVVAWSSDRNGYDDKEFLITVMEDLPNANQVVGTQEIDPSDYDWSSDFEIDVDVIPLTPLQPPPQMMTGWQALPAIFYDADGNERRPSIEVQYDGGLDDVRAVRVQVRLTGQTALAFDGEVPYDKSVADPSVVLNGVFLPNTPYEVRGIYVPFSGRVVRWSNQEEDGTDGPWLAVTTPNVLLGAWDLYEGVIGFDHLDEDFEEYLDWINGGSKALIEAIQQHALFNVEEHHESFDDVQKIERNLTSEIAGARAEFSEQITVATGPGSALAQQIISLSALLSGKADATALSALTTRVTANENSITSISSALLSLSTVVDGKASASVVQGIQSTVTQQGNTLNAQSDYITELSSALGGDDEANVMVRFQTSASTPSGFSARIGLQASSTQGGVFRAASLFLDVPSGSGPTRVAVGAEQFVVFGTGAGAQNPFIVQGGVVYMDTARIRDLTVDHIKLVNGSMGSTVFAQQNSTDVNLGPSGSISNQFPATVVGRGGSVVAIAKGTISAIVGSAGDANKFGGVSVALTRNGSIVDSGQGYVDDDQSKDLNFFLMSKANAVTGSETYALAFSRSASTPGALGGQGSGNLHIRQCRVMATEYPKVA